MKKYGGMRTNLRTSALTGEGIERVAGGDCRGGCRSQGGLREAAMLTNLRQHQAVEQAPHGLDAARPAGPR